MNLPETLVGAVDDDAYIRLQALPGPHNANLAQWLESWRTGVVRFFEEMDLPREEWSDRTGHRHDWSGLLHHRTIVGRTYNEQLADVPAAAAEWLAQVDDFMRVYTEEVPDWATSDDDATDVWWWHRLPVRGPVRAGWWADE